MSRTVRKIGAVGASTTLLGGAGSALLLALVASPAGAVPSTWTVDTLADGAGNATDCTTPVVGSCSLRDALAAATAGDGIEFSASLFTGGAGTITLTNGSLINNGANIVGPGANLLTVNANSGARVFQMNAAATTLSGMTITGGSFGGPGGGIAGSSDLTLDRMVVTGNSADAGAGVFAAGLLTLVDSTISSNSASSGGGGVVAAGLTMTRSTISGNTAGLASGGVYVSGSTTVIDSTISGNSVTGGSGGGLLVSGDLTISGSTVSGNTASSQAGGIFVGGQLNMSGSTVSGNSTSTAGGAGMLAFGAASIVDSTFAMNTANSCGGALYFGANDSSLSILSSTFSGNQATNCAGGAVYVYATGSTVTIANSTFTANSAVSGGALRIDPGNIVQITMSTITGNI
ncbi:MAG: right-handed parallel beta-helix repeat-containing protein, partial [Ilumatobacteraceae bacterium]|nr:right-handed parallel beta-helix repeat-containing protein [Ilumatobacteraceae bacterium]